MRVSLTTYPAAMSALPIASKFDDIVAAVAANDVTIVEAETGAGKTIALQLWLWKTFYADKGIKGRIIVTEPTTLTCEMVARAVASMTGTELEDLACYRHAKSPNKGGSVPVTYMTDGLKIAQMLFGKNNLDENIILVIDEAHTRSTNVDTMLALVKKYKGRMKVVIMSATMDATALSTYYGGAPVIKVAGRTYPCEGSPACGKLDQRPLTEGIKAIKDYAEMGLHTLVFVPGTGEINETIAELAKAGLTYEKGYRVMPLHSQSGNHGEINKTVGDMVNVIVSTNVARTGVTIEAIDAVVTFGKNREMRYVNGVESLVLCDTSQAGVIQEMGRASRMKAGYATLISNTPWEHRAAYDTPEMQRVPVDTLYLRLTGAGLRPFEMDFLSPPSPKVLAETKKTLVFLGLIDEDGNITYKGNDISKFPMNINYSLMILEAEKRGVVDSVVTAIAIAQTRSGSVTFKKDQEGRYVSLKDPKREQNSDLWEQVLIYRAGKHAHLNFNALREARANYQNIVGATKTTTRHDNDSEVEFRKCILAGQYLNLHRVGMTGYVPYVLETGRRILTRESVVDKQSTWVVGIPFSVDKAHLLTYATKVELEWVMELFPNFVKGQPTTKDGVFGYNSNYKIGDNTITTVFVAEPWPIAAAESHCPPFAYEATNRAYWLGQIGVLANDPAKKETTFNNYVVSSHFGEDKLVRSVEQLEQLAAGIPQEKIDEYFFDFFGTTIAETENLTIAGFKVSTQKQRYSSGCMLTGVTPENIIAMGEVLGAKFQQHIVWCNASGDTCSYDKAKRMIAEAEKAKVIAGIDIAALKAEHGEEWFEGYQASNLSYQDHPQEIVNGILERKQIWESIKASQADIVGFIEKFERSHYDTIGKFTYTATKFANCTITRIAEGTSTGELVEALTAIETIKANGVIAEQEQSAAMAEYDVLPESIKETAESVVNKEKVYTLADLAKVVYKFNRMNLAGMDIVELEMGHRRSWAEMVRSGAVDGFLGNFDVNDIKYFLAEVLGHYRENGYPTTIADYPTTATRMGGSKFREDEPELTTDSPFAALFAQAEREKAEREARRRK